MDSNKQKGSQAVEFALVLPFLILIIFAVLDFGILAYDKAIITNASREAARQGIVLSTAAWDPATIKQVACNYAKSALITVNSGTRTSTCTGGAGSADPVITVSPSAAPVFNTPVTVTVSYAVKGFSLGSWWSLGTGPNTVGSAITLVSTTQMNHE
ncbi:TadE/TadG family type IV pilus assembly protein [Collimonas antrihumi]|uniref:TadE/TadG family type IV pilus assembly protein n=1 Tax=Collimonas antrihumi TaxID=1940615 RepID=UPI001B8C20A1|nr:TadE/TadG family type IV pilus assembly protein [Collimonas antrihumi]